MSDDNRDPFQKTVALIIETNGKIHPSQLRAFYKKVGGKGLFTDAMDEQIKQTMDEPSPARTARLLAGKIARDSAKYIKKQIPAGGNAEGDSSPDEPKRGR